MRACCVLLIGLGGDNGHWVACREELNYVAKTGGETITVVIGPGNSHVCDQGSLSLLMSPLTTTAATTTTRDPFVSVLQVVASN